MKRWIGVTFGAAVAVAVVATGPTVTAQTAEAAPTVIVLVVDGLLADEVGPTTPTLQSLKDTGTWFEQSRSVMIAETIPNHVAMMTGVYPERSNIPANSFWDRDETALVARDLSDPAEFTADTLFTTLDRSCPGLRTASVLSKTYLYEIFRSGGQNVSADFHWEPGPIIPESGHTPDLNTMNQVLAALPDHDLLFVNLGDVDRAGHVDVVGGLFDVPADLGIAELPTPNNAAVRQVALRNTDTLIGQLVRALTDAGRWDDTLLIVVSDHGMDWSDPFGFVSVQPVLDESFPDRFFVVQNGGADTVFLRNPGRSTDGADLVAARSAVLAAFPDAIAHAWYREDNPSDPDPDHVVPAQFRLQSPNAGDLVLVAEDGWRFSDPSESSNPIPGNHGHLVTRHNTFLVTGGHPALAAARSIAAPAEDPENIEDFDNQSENVDVAPTVAWFLGLPTDQYQGRVLTEAFTSTTSPSDCRAVGPSLGDRVGSGVVTEVATGGGLPSTGSNSGPALLAFGALAGFAALWVRRIASDTGHDRQAPVGSGHPTS